MYVKIMDVENIFIQISIKVYFLKNSQNFDCEISDCPIRIGYDNNSKGLQLQLNIKL